MRLGDRLSAERKKQQLSAETVAQVCGVSRSYITLIENGERLPSTKVIPHLAAALGLKTAVILNWYLEDMTEKVQKKLDL